MLRCGNRNIRITPGLFFCEIRTSGRFSSFHRRNHPKLTVFDPDLIPLQHLVEGSANVGGSDSAFNGPKVNLGEVAVGLLPNIFTDLIHNIFHIHCDITPLFYRHKATW